MDCPENIENKIIRRARAARRFMELDKEVSDWCVKHNIETEYIHGYIETIVNPEWAACSLLDDIARK